MTLPPDALALRREALVIAADRQFRGRLDPIPEMPEVPGLYRRLPRLPENKAARLAAIIAQSKALLRERRRNRYQKERKRPFKSRAGCSPSHSLAKGDLPAGTIVPVPTCGSLWEATGEVLGFLPAMADPHLWMPAGTGCNYQGGHRFHGPAKINRYVIRAAGRGKMVGKWIYHFPKATTVERQVLEMAG